jgi:polysaccharide biosynthesis transport protein
LANQIADDYLDQQRKSRIEQMRQVATWLHSHVDELQTRLAATEASIEKLKARTGLTKAVTKEGVESNIAEQRISDLTSELVAVRVDLENKQATFDQARRILESHNDVTNIPEVMASPFISQLRLQQADLLRQQSDLRGALGVHSPALVRTHLASIDAAINAEAAHIVSNLKTAYESALRREQSLDASLKKITDELGASPDYVQLQQQTRMAKADSDLYQSYFNQFNYIATRQTYQGPGAQIISPATVPDLPSKPNRSLFYGIGCVLGLGMGLGLAFVLEYFYSGIRTGTEVERKFGYPVLGIIPLVQPAKKHESIEPALLMQKIVDAPLSSLGEAVRAVRVCMGPTNSISGSKVILVTSSIIGEGKSAAAMLLAASNAMSGKTVVLVDCDLRQRTVSKAVGMPGQGLADLLRGGLNSINDVLITGPKGQPHVIPSGSTSASATDLLASADMSGLIALLRERYDRVVLDVAPVLGTVDALALATLVDQIIVVVEWQRTPQDAIGATFKLLERSGHRITGVVLNKVDPKQVRGYGYGYGSV